MTDAACCYVLKRNENILQLTADDVNFLSKENMQMKCVDTIKKSVLLKRTWFAEDKVLAKKRQHTTCYSS